MIVCGDRDPFVPIGHAWELQRQLPDARLFVAPDCGHEVMVEAAGAVQRGARRLLPVDEAVANAGPSRARALATSNPRPPEPDHAHTL
jgi:hypothetical protein